MFDTISYTVSNYARQWQIAMGVWPVYNVWPMPSHFIFESSDNWLDSHKADWRWPIIILHIGRDGPSHVARERSLEVFWILLIGSRYHRAHWDLWNRTIGPLETKFNEILINIDTFSFAKMHFKRPSTKWQPFCPCLYVLKWVTGINPAVIVVTLLAKKVVTPSLKTIKPM